eukprot:4088926-Pyramimonas_sp.AAC.1
MGRWWITQGRDETLLDAPKEKLKAVNGKLVTVSEPPPPRPNGSQFVITTAPAPALDPYNLVVGRYGAVYSHDGPIRRNKRGYSLMTDQSDTRSAAVSSLENSILPPILYGRRMFVSSPSATEQRTGGMPLISIFPTITSGVLSAPLPVLAQVERVLEGYELVAELSQLPTTKSNLSSPFFQVIPTAHAD